MTTDYLLDTNACIAIRTLLGGKQPKSAEIQQRIAKLKTRWSAVPKERLAMSIVTLGELRFGVEKSNNPGVAKARLEALRQQVTVLMLDEHVTEHYGSIRAHLETQGCKIGTNDTWIAAHGRAAQRTVVTNNVREFARVPNLLHEDWTT
jgi:tRNA(fMet)-specific endonuclease VapC